VGRLGAHHQTDHEQRREPGDRQRQQPPDRHHLHRTRLAGRAVVELAMRYGEPSIAAALEGFLRRGVSRIVVFPLYPQLSSAATGSSIAAVRAAAARSLAQQARGTGAEALERQRQVVPLLQKALEDPALEVVVEAAEDLGALGVPEAGPVLTVLLRHPSPPVRQTAAQALERVAEAKLPGRRRHDRAVDERGRERAGGEQEQPGRRRPEAGHRHRHEAGRERRVQAEEAPRLRVQVAERCPKRGSGRQAGGAGGLERVRAHPFTPAVVTPAMK
jgi:hypothetical protein